VFHLTYRVREVPAEEIGAGNCGFVDTAKGEILILDSMPHPVKVDTLVHELVHAHLVAIGHDDSEGLVMGITTCVLSFLKQNPAIASGLRPAQP
jgi:hypothetical protein